MELSNLATSAATAHHDNDNLKNNDSQYEEEEDYGGESSKMEGVDVDEQHGHQGSAIMISHDDDDVEDGGKIRDDDDIDIEAAKYGEYNSNNYDDSNYTDEDDDYSDDDQEGISLLPLSSSSSKQRHRVPSSRDEEQSSSINRWKCMLYYHWFGGNSNSNQNNDRPLVCSIGSPQGGYSTQIVLLDSNGTKLVKFVLVVVGCILIVHYYAIIMGDKHDHTYNLQQMILYDGNHIALDLIVFFFVGRLYEQDDVDTCIWSGPVILSALIQSWAATHLESLRHSITPKEIHCDWGGGMWLLIIVASLLLVVIVAAHAFEAIRQGIGVRKLVELVLMLVVFLVPYTGNTFFHLHHWYYAWLFGMHFNLDVWWSRLIMSIMVGVYVNGIAIFGRDPIMTCAVSLYQSQNQQCPYLMNDAVTAGEMGAGSSNYTLDDLAHAMGNDWEDTGCNTTDIP
jgi:hypothetical protein